MRADTTAGGWPSAAAACTDPALIWLPAPSRIRFPSMSSVPDAPVGASGSASSNRTVWVVEKPASEGSPGLRVPSDPRFSVPYAPASQATGSLYVIWISRGPVIRADSGTGAMPSAIPSDVIAPSLLPARSSTKPSPCW